LTSYRGNGRYLFLLFGRIKAGDFIPQLTLLPGFTWIVLVNER